MTKNAPQPITVVQMGGSWEVRNQLAEVLIREDTKRKAVDGAKDWARENRYERPVVIHTADGKPQRVWWTEDQRYIRVRPMNGREQDKYRSMLNEFEHDGHHKPYWSVERKKGRWDLNDIQPTKREAVETARTLQARYTIRTISVYGTDWTQTREITHEIERGVR